jgi:PAS domain S-box-containing protein
MIEKPNDEAFKQRVKALETTAGNYAKANPKQQRELRMKAEALLRMKPEDLEKIPFNDTKSLIHELQQIKKRYKIQYLGSPIPTITWQRVEDAFKIIDYNFAALSFTGGEISKYTGTIAGEFYTTRPDILADFDRCFKKRSIVKRKTPYQMITTGEEKDLVLTLAFIPPDLIFQYFEDLTDYIQAEKALAESEAKYRQLFESESDAVMVFDAETGRFEDANRTTLDLYGYSKEEFLTLTVEDISAEKEKTRIAVHRYNKGKPGSERVPLRYFKKKDGTIFPGEIAAGKFISGGRKKMIEAVRDITEREQANKKLKESEERYRSLVDNIAIGVTFISPDMEILTLNNHMKQWYPHIDPSKKPLCYQVFNDPPRDKVCSYCPTFKTLRDGKVHEATTETPAGGEIRSYRIISSPVKDYEGNVVAAIEMVEDITERRRTEAHIQNLSHQLLKVQESERQMISSELHDTVAQDLSTLKMAVKTLFDKQRKEPPETKQKISEFFKMLNRSILTVRNLSYDLRPPGLEEIGILQSLSTYCEEFSENTGIKVEFHSAGLKNPALDSFSEINLYRLIQEGLNNVRKHADASRVTINLVGAHPNIILRIEDDGKGFDVQARELALGSEKRMGLRSMKERVNLLQGRMTIQSRPMKGTKISIKFPIKKGQRESKKPPNNH